MGKHVDINEALSKLNNSKTLYIHFLKGFMRKYGNIKDEIDILYKKKDYETMKCLIHSIKGLSGNLGANELQKYAKKLEELLDNQDYSFENLYCNFKEELQVVQREVAEIIIAMEAE